MTNISMKIAFLDLSKRDYSPDAPFLEPLGGIKSGLIYLALELCKAGHEITILNNTSAPRMYSGIRCLNLYNVLSADFLNTFDYIVSISCDAGKLKNQGLKRPLLLWTGHNHEESSVQCLASKQEATNWDFFIFKSQWQAITYIKKFNLAPGKCRVIGNAVSPFFESLGKRSSYFFTEGRPPRFYYSSTPFRGLAVLLQAFPKIQKAFPGSTLRVHSSMKPYKMNETHEYLQLYEKCNSMEGVEYIGSFPQAELSESVQEMDVLAFPSIYAETACITLMEAMTSGCIPMCTDLGALRETAAGFGYLYAFSGQENLVELASFYAEFVIASLQSIYKNPGEHIKTLEAQVDYAHTHYSWKRRSEQWLFLLGNLKKT